VVAHYLEPRALANEFIVPRLIHAPERCVRRECPRGDNRRVGLLLVTDGEPRCVVVHSACWHSIQVRKIKDKFRRVALTAPDALVYASIERKWCKGVVGDI